MRQKLLFNILGILGIFLICSAPSYALCLLCTCTASAQTINFGTYTISAQDAVTGTFTVGCTAILALSATVTVSAATGSSGSYTNRTLTKGTSSLNYNLYTTSAYSTVWGDGTSGTSTMNQTQAIGLLTTTFFNFPVYGRIPALQDVAPGTYTDSLIVTVTY